jgi:hypothetical protein
MNTKYFIDNLVSHIQFILNSKCFFEDKLYMQQYRKEGEKKREREECEHENVYASQPECTQYQK